MKLHFLLVSILGIFLKNGLVSALRFVPTNEIKVDNPNGSIEVGKQAKLTCNYVIRHGETVDLIRWFFSVNGLQENVSQSYVSTIYCICLL